jgi:Na+/phosphate symporter
MSENIQANYEELKKKSELTDKFIKLANKLEIDDKDVPKTEKGMESKVKELMERLEKKLDKEEVKELNKKAGKRVRKNYYIKKKKRL